MQFYPSPLGKFIAPREGGHFRPPHDKGYFCPKVGYLLFLFSDHHPGDRLKEGSVSGANLLGKRMNFLFQRVCNFLSTTSSVGNFLRMRHLILTWFQPHPWPGTLLTSCPSTSGSHDTQKATVQQQQSSSNFPSQPFCPFSVYPFSFCVLTCLTHRLAFIQQDFTGCFSCLKN